MIEMHLRSKMICFSFFLLFKRWIQIFPKSHHCVSYQKRYKIERIKLNRLNIQHRNQKFGARQKIRNQKAVKLSEKDFCKYLYRPFGPFIFTNDRQFISIFIRKLFQITKYSTCAKTERSWNWRWRFNDSGWSNWNLLSHPGRILEPSRSDLGIQAKLKTIKLCENIFLPSKWFLIYSGTTIKRPPL